MAEAVYFIVSRRAGREEAAIIHDLVPGWLKPLIVYQLRLDRLPDAERWLAMPLDRLYAEYVLFRDHGRLPPSNVADPPQKKEPAKILAGHRERYGLEHDPRPAEPLPTPGEVISRPLGGAFIGPEQIAESDE